MSFVDGYPARRNTKAYEIRIGSLHLSFSYGTCIAVRYPPLGICARVRNDWGPTTGRHMNEMGLRSYAVVSQDELEGLVKQAISHMGLELFKDTLEGRKAA